MKNKILLYLIATIALPWLSACRKDDPPTIIRGRVTEYGTQKPIEGARVYVLCYEGTIFGPSGSTLADSIVSQADGTFYREYPPAELCGSAYLVPWKAGYFKGSELDLTTDNKRFDIVLDPEAWLRLITIPDGPAGYDHIGIGGDFRCETWASDGLKTFIFLTRGNRDHVIRWGPFKDPSIKFPDTLYLPAHDTTVYTIHH